MPRTSWPADVCTPPPLPPGRGRALSEAEHDRIYTLHQQGWKARQIAKELGRSLSSVYASIEDARLSRGEVDRVRALRRNLEAGGDGLVPPKPKLPIGVVVNRYLAGESLKTLASAFRVSRNTIRLLLVSAGVTIRANKMKVPEGFRPWTRVEAIACRKLAAEGFDCATIGLAINRSTSAVACWLQEDRNPTQAGKMAERARRRRGDLLPEEMLPAAVADQLLAGWREGHTVAELARQHDIPSAIVSGTLKQLGVRVRRGPNPIRLQKLAAALPPKGIPLFQPPRL
jgi:hypothetical protein